MRVALVHYWLVKWRGGEKALKAVADLFPDCDIYTHVFDPELVSREFPKTKIYTTFIAQLPLARRYYQRYLPLMPFALEQLDLRGYDLVISNESGPAKGIVVGPHTTHVCFCQSPMRYAWDMYHEYRAQSGLLTRALMVPLMSWLRQWDQVSAQRVDHYIANSSFVASRIKKYYRRDSVVIHPPVATNEFRVSTTDDGFYLSVGQLVSYKRPDLLVEAFNLSGKRLVIIGDGALLPSLRKLANPNVELVGWQSSGVIREHYARCRALVFPGIEDFGIVPVEAMASGKPVIAFQMGGALETVVEGVSGLFFGEQTSASLIDAVDRFEANADQFDPYTIRAQAEKFSIERFNKQFKDHINDVLSEK
jgi:glycosyltransferase involved in cell wall biosynthesis